MKVEIYSDVACPWCYVGKARFERAVVAFAGEPVEVVYRPYQLDPSAPHQAVPMMDYLSRRFGARARGMADNMIATAQREGLVMDYDRGLSVNTFDAHRLMRLAETEYGVSVQHALGEALFKAHFSEGRDVGDVDTLVDLAKEVGVDAERARRYLTSGEGTSEVQRDIAEARGLGITAVPTFVFDEKYAIQGAQPTSVFLQALEQVAQESAATGDDSASCADGSCAV